MKNVYLIVVMALLFLSCKDIRKEFYENGKLSTEIEYNDGIQKGNVVSYYPNGVIKEKYKAVNMIPDGEYKNYYDNGQMKLKVNYNNGLQEGILLEYFTDGTLKSKQEFKNGVPNGTVKLFYNNGKLQKDVLFNKDTIKYYVEFDSLGNWLEEYRECSVDIPKDELHLGEEYSIKFNIAGPIIEGDKLQVSMMIYQTGGEKYPQIYFMDIKNPELKFTPPHAGKWGVVGGIFLTRGGKVVWSYDQKEFTFNVIERESTTMN